jgi:hypothetical protein
MTSPTGATQGARFGASIRIYDKWMAIAEANHQVHLNLSIDHFFFPFLLLLNVSRRAEQCTSSNT